MENFLSSSKNKTRVLILTTCSEIAKLVVHVLYFNEKSFDFQLENGESQECDNDFVILEASELEKAIAFKPNIVLITSEIDGTKSTDLSPNIIGGGVLIHPSTYNDTVDRSGTFFRKMEFDQTEHQKNESSSTLKTALGPIPFASTDDMLIKNIEGIKLLAQQFGVMEEEFYEAVMEFR